MSSGATPVGTPIPTPRPAEMLALQWHGKKDMRVVRMPQPSVTQETDAIIQISSTAICGSDLHLYNNAMPGMQRGDVMGHEFMGTVTSVGEKVTGLHPGDRVVACFDIGCGQCFFCNKGLFSCCDNSNPSPAQEALYGDRTAGIYGYTHLTGGWQGGQAEFARVPFADVNLLQVPSELDDDQALFLSDILPTAWHANELGGVGEGDNVAIWGAGPVGVLAAHCAMVRGAARVVMIDREDYRLEWAMGKLPGVEAVNFAKVTDVVKALRDKFQHGPDVGIDAVGMHYTKSWTHALEMTAGLETDPAEIVNEIIMSVRKGGRIGIVGVYGGYCNHFNIGAFMEKGLTMSAGQTPVQKYWEHLLKMVQENKLDPTIVITHHLPLEDGPHGYRIFNNKEENCMKVVLQPGARRAGA